MSAKAEARPGETRLVTAAELAAWAGAARAGELIVYCCGPTLPAGPTADKARALRDRGVVRLHFRRAGTVTEYLAVRRAPEPPVEVSVAARRDAALDTIMAALRRAARAGRRCPSDVQLARIAELPSRAAAQWRVRKLEQAGRIRVETLAGPDGPWRVVRVGKFSTARPPSRAREARP